MALSTRSYEWKYIIAFSRSCGCGSNNAHAPGVCWEMSRGYVYLELRRTLRYGDPERQLTHI